MKTPIHAVCALFLFLHVVFSSVDQQLLRGFVAISVHPKAEGFQPILRDSNGYFTLSFIKVKQQQLALGIIHMPSRETLWQAGWPQRLAPWANTTKLIFNGSLVIISLGSKVIWSTNTDGDKVLLTVDGNLQIKRACSVLWQSFDFPSDTLMGNQRFTSGMTLVSSNQLYTMRLGPDFVAMYAKFNPGLNESERLRYRREALETTVQIFEEEQYPAKIHLETDNGFLALYLHSVEVKVTKAFTNEPRVRRFQIVSDGNFESSYWSGKKWVSDYRLIDEPCALPSACGRYGLCTPGKGCSCLENESTTKAGKCDLAGTEPPNLCKKGNNKYREIQKAGVDLPFKDFMVSTEKTSYDECMKECKCTCWGALYNNTSRKCYLIEYPIQTVLSVDDKSNIGYFKVWENARNYTLLYRVLLALGVGGVVVVLVSLVYKACTPHRDQKRSRND